MKFNLRSLPSLIAICITFFTTTNAQIRFQKTYGGPILDWSNSVIQTTDSNYLLLGSTRNFGSGMEDVYLIKTDQHGDTLWSQSYGGSTNDEEGTNVQQTADGGFIISGTTESFGAGSSDFFLLKTDSVGNIQWANTYGGPNVDFCTGTQQCFDGGYIISGYTTSFGAGGGGTTDIYLVKTDVWGDTLWTKTFGSSGVEMAFNVKQTADSGFVVAGCTNVNGSQDVYIIKTDSAGEISWTKTYGGSAEDIGYAVVQTNDGYCIAGSTMSFGSGAMDVYMIKTDINGDTLWSRTFGTNDSDACVSIQQTADAGYIMTGYANKLNGVFDDILIIKTDAAGQMVWDKVVGGASSARDVGRCVTQAIDGGYLVSGFTQSFGGGTEIILIKTDSGGSSGCNELNKVITMTTPNTIVGSYYPQISHGGTIGFPVVIENNAPGIKNILCETGGIRQLTGNQNQITVTPNPFTTTAEVKITGNIATGRMLFVLTDMMGVEVSKTIINSSDISHIQTTNKETLGFKIERNKLLPGVYIYHVISLSSGSSDAGNMMGIGKLMVE